MTPFITIRCHGISRKGKRVGTRHRWEGATMCQWCGRWKDQVRITEAEYTRRLGVKTETFPS